jgi:hypothetical protein
VNGNVADLRICGILTNSSLVSISGQVQTIAVYGAPGGPTVSADSTLRIGSLRTVLNLTGELAGTIDITGTAQSSQIHILGNLSGSLLAGLFGNVTIMGRFTGIIGDAGTAAGKGNTLIVTMRGGGGIVAPAKAFANYFGYP